MHGLDAHASMVIEVDVLVPVVVLVVVDVLVLLDVIEDVVIVVEG